MALAKTSQFCAMPRGAVTWSSRRGRSCGFFSDELPGRCSHREVRFRKAVVLQFSKTVLALNWMEWTSGGDPVSWSLARSHVLWCSVGLLRPLSLFPDRLTVILVRQVSRGRSLGASLEATFVAKVDPWRPRELSQRTSARTVHSDSKSFDGCPLLTDICTHKAQVFSDAPAQRMLRTEADDSELESELGPAGFDVDAVLGRSRRHYVTCVRDLFGNRNHCGSPQGRLRWPASSLSVKRMDHCKRYLIRSPRLECSMLRRPRLFGREKVSIVSR